MAVVDKNVDQHGTRAVAEAYLDFLYTPAGQEHHRQATTSGRATPRPSRPSYAAQFPKLPLVTIDEHFGGWAKAQADALRRRRHRSTRSTSRER